MPIEHELQIEQLGRDEYHALDYRVMGEAFAVHSELGRLHNERVYQNELSHRCVECGLDVKTEVPVVVSHDTFVKTLFLDMVIDGSIVYELKTVRTLLSEHRAQALNYLFLVGAQHGKLVNFRPSSVKSEYVTTTLIAADRYDIQMDDASWLSAEEESSFVRNRFKALLLDWGAFLDPRLYSEAIVHFMGGEAKVVRPIEIVRDGRLLGHAKAILLNNRTALYVTSIKMAASAYEKHLRRLLEHTRLTRIQWVNMKGRHVRFVTISD